MSTQHRTPAQKKADALKAKRTAAGKKPRKMTVVKTLKKTDAPSNVKQKNVTGVVQLKNKSTLTTLKGGRKIQQVAGKSAYVVAKGQGKASGVRPASQKLPPGQAKMKADSKKKK